MSLCLTLITEVIVKLKKQSADSYFLIVAKAGITEVTSFLTHYLGLMSTRNVF